MARKVISCVFIAAAFIFVILAINVTGGESFFDFSGVVRNVFCGTAIINILIAAIVWKSQNAQGKRIRIVITIAAVCLVLLLGYLDQYFLFFGS